MMIMVMMMVTMTMVMMMIMCVHFFVFSSLTPLHTVSCAIKAGRLRPQSANLTPFKVFSAPWPPCGHVENRLVDPALRWRWLMVALRWRQRRLMVTSVALVALTVAAVAEQAAVALRVPNLLPPNLLRQFAGLVALASSTPAAPDLLPQPR